MLDVQNRILYHKDNKIDNKINNVMNNKKPEVNYCQNYVEWKTKTGEQW